MKIFNATITLFFLLSFSAYSSSDRHHATDLPAPQQFNAHFGDIDTDQNDLVTLDELKAYFPKADRSVFEALDLNQDGNIDHDEWHEFKEAHGMHH